MDAAGFGKAPPVNASVERLPGQPAETQVRNVENKLENWYFAWPAHSGTCSCVLCLYVFIYGSSRSEMEQLLCTCSGFVYLGMERFLTTIPPDKIAALNMPGIVWTYMVLVCMIWGNVLCVCDFMTVKQSWCAESNWLACSSCLSNMRFCSVVILVPFFTWRVVMCSDSTAYFLFLTLPSIFWAHLSLLWFGCLAGMEAQRVWQPVPEISLAEFHLLFAISLRGFWGSTFGVPLKTLLVRRLFCCRIITNLCGSSLCMLVTRFDLIFL